MKFTWRTSSWAMIEISFGTPASLMPGTGTFGPGSGGRTTPVGVSRRPLARNSLRSFFARR
ncbi:MAG: hypothetical protein NTU94_18455 [Planctomycetota bacterium]|nr:hypothetical protein [Planctomycetota bacterium]